MNCPAASRGVSFDCFCQYYRSKLRGIEPGRFRNLDLTIIVICVICGLKEAMTGRRIEEKIEVKNVRRWEGFKSEVGMRKWENEG